MIPSRFIKTAAKLAAEAALGSLDRYKKSTGIPNIVRHDGAATALALMSLAAPEAWPLAGRAVVSELAGRVLAPRSSPAVAAAPPAPA